MERTVSCRTAQNSIPWSISTFIFLAVRALRMSLVGTSALALSFDRVCCLNLARRILCILDVLRKKTLTALPPNNCRLAHRDLSTQSHSFNNTAALAGSSAGPFLVAEAAIAADAAMAAAFVVVVSDELFAGGDDAFFSRSICISF